MNFFECHRKSVVGDIIKVVLESHIIYQKVTANISNDVSSVMEKVSTSDLLYNILEKEWVVVDMDMVKVVRAMSTGVPMENGRIYVHEPLRGNDGKDYYVSWLRGYAEVKVVLEWVE